MVRLPVNGAFHTPMMNQAERRLEVLLKDVELGDANVCLVSNSTAQMSKDAVAIRDALMRQMTSPVLLAAVDPDNA